MNEGFMNFFERPVVMKWSAFLAAIAGIAECIVYFILDGGPRIQHPIYLGLAIGVFFLYRAYMAHDKNVMKGLLGVVLAGLLFNEVAYLYTVYPAKYAAVSGGDPAWGILYISVEAIFVLLQICIFLNHFVINSDHHSSPVKVQFNQLLFVTMAIVILLQELVGLVTLNSNNFLPLLGQLLWFVLELGVYNTVICIESKLDGYRILREAKGWTEKK